MSSTSTTTSDVDRRNRLLLVDKSNVARAVVPRGRGPMSSEPSSPRCRPDADRPYCNRHEGDQGDEPGTMSPHSNRHREQDGPNGPKHDGTPEGRQESCEQVRNCDQCVDDESDRRARLYPASGAGGAHFDVPVVGGPLGDRGPGGNTADVTAPASARGWVSSTRTGLENGVPCAGSCRLWVSSAYLSYQ